MKPDFLMLRLGALLVSALVVQGCPLDERTMLLSSGGTYVVDGGTGSNRPQGGASGEGGEGGEGADTVGGNSGAAGSNRGGSAGNSGQGGSQGGSGATTGTGGYLPDCVGSRCSCFGDDGVECRSDNCCRTTNVPTGSFELGGSAGPSVAASVEGFGLDKYEVTVGRFRKYVEHYLGAPTPEAGQHPFVVASGWQPPWDAFMPTDADALEDALACDDAQATWTDEPGENEARPINCVTWFEAFAFCAWDGGRLPTEAEWEYAASGGDEARGFPWGDEAPNAERALYSVTDLALVGSKPSGAGRFEHLDLAGSVGEWVLDWHAPYTDPCNNCANVESASERVTRGGSFLSSRDVDLSSTERAPETPAERFPAVGFRCARDE